MATRLDEYCAKYPHIEFQRDEQGILLMRLHDGSGGELLWTIAVHHELASAWRDVGDDPDTKLIIFTAAGDAFLRREDLDADSIGEAMLEDRSLLADALIAAHGPSVRLQLDLLDVEQPMIAAINGPVTVHAELPLLCDVVLAAEHTVIADAPHFDVGSVPGDGVQVVFPLLMGLNRARYFMLLGQQLSARECLELGLFNEVLPQEELLPRAYELARKVLEAPPATVRLFRRSVLLQVKSMMLASVGHGLALEHLALISHWPDKAMNVPRVPSDPE